VGAMSQMSNTLTSPISDDRFVLIPIEKGLNMWGKIERIGKRWRLRGTWAKKRITLSRYIDGKILDDERLAIRLQERISSEIDGKTFDPSRYLAKSPFQFLRAVQIWIDGSTCSEEWKGARKRITRDIFIPFFGTMDIREIRSLHINEFHSHLKNIKRISDKTIYNIMGELRAMLRKFSDELVKVPSFPRLTYQVPGIRMLTYEQQEQVFEFIPEADKAIFQFWRHTGCRPNEARGLLRENVFLRDGYLILATVSVRAGEIRENTKSKKIKIFAITPELADPLKPRFLGRFVFMHFDLRHKKFKPYSRSILWRIWTKANKEANKKYGVSIINPYNAFRHSFACQKLSEGVPIDGVQQMMGHTSIKTTQRYAEYDLDKLREWMKPKLVKNGKTLRHGNGNT